MKTRWGIVALTGAALAASVLTLAPATGASTIVKKRSAASLSMATGLGSFTPAAADPRLAAAYARGGFANSGFHFTPSSAPGSRRAVTVAVRARATTKAEAERTAMVTAPAITPTAYNLGVAVGWKRFAILGDIARVDPGVLPGGREAVDLGLSYSGRQWSTRVQLAADRSVGDLTRVVSGVDEAYSVDIGGSYSLTRNLELNGGVRYRSQRDHLELTDERRDSQAVYVGTAFKF